MDASIATTSAATGASRLPRKFAFGAIFAAVLTITLGGMTTSTDSGMAFLDWPLSNGSWWPEDMSLMGYFEHLHRAAGALTGLFILLLFGWAVVHRERLAESGRPGLRVHGALLVLVIVQGVFGGVGVLLKLPLFTSVTHAILAQVTLCLAGFLAFAHSADWERRTSVAPEVSRSARKYVAVAGCAIVLQTLLGAFSRHVRDDSHWYAVWGHVVWSIFVMALVGIASAYTGGRLKEVRGVRRAANWVFLVLIIQMSLGFVALLVHEAKHPENIQFLWRASLRTSHVVTGALLLMTVAFLGFRTFRGAKPEPGVSA